MSSIINCVKKHVLYEEQSSVVDTLRDKQLGHLEDKVDPKIARIMAVDEVLKELYAERVDIINQIEAKIPHKTKVGRTNKIKVEPFLKVEKSIEVDVEESSQLKKEVTLPKAEIKKPAVTKPSNKKHSEAVSKIVEEVNSILLEKQDLEKQPKKKEARKIVIEQDSIVLIDPA